MVKKIGQGSFVVCEWNSVEKEHPDFQRTLVELERRVIDKCDGEWAPKTVGYLTPQETQYGRTTILPELFRGWAAAAPYPVLAHWRQYLGAAGHQILLMGNGAGNVIPEDFRIAWMGLMFPNKQQQITELKWQISDSKFTRVNIEELRGYSAPALIFEKGYILNEKETFELYGYVEHPDYQRVIMLGAAYYRVIDRVLGNCGAMIT